MRFTLAITPKKGQQLRGKNVLLLTQALSVDNNVCTIMSVMYYDIGRGWHDDDIQKGQWRTTSM